MARIIKSGTAGKDRILLEKGIALAIRQLAIQRGLDETTRDLLAYVALSLLAISETIGDSVAAWEKRGYWLKADHYRMEWSWTGRLGDELKNAILKEDWAEVARISAQVSQKMNHMKISERNRLGTPWVGSYQKLVRPNQGH